MWSWLRGKVHWICLAHTHKDIRRSSGSGKTMIMQLLHNVNYHRQKCTLSRAHTCTHYTICTYKQTNKQTLDNTLNTLNTLQTSNTRHTNSNNNSIMEVIVISNYISHIHTHTHTRRQTLIVLCVKNVFFSQVVPMQKFCNNVAQLMHLGALID